MGFEKYTDVWTFVCIFGSRLGQHLFSMCVCVLHHYYMASIHDNILFHFKKEKVEASLVMITAIIEIQAQYLSVFLR